jgi:putative flippase GtrA
MVMSRVFTFAKYALIGLVGTAVQYAVLIGLVAMHAASAVVASTIGAMVGACVNYLLNYRLTFKSTARHGRAAPRFFCVAAVGVMINAVVMSALADRLHVQYLVAQCVSTACVLVTGFIVNSLWSFRAAPP